LNATIVFSQYILGLGCPNDQFSVVGGGTDFHSGIAFFGQFSHQEFIQFQIKHSIGNKLFLNNVEDSDEDFGFLAP
jgi:hypothetical protein